MGSPTVYSTNLIVVMERRFPGCKKELLDGQGCPGRGDGPTDLPFANQLGHKFIGVNRGVAFPGDVERARAPTLFCMFGTRRLHAYSLPVSFRIDCSELTWREGGRSMFLPLFSPRPGLKAGLDTTTSVCHDPPMARGSVSTTLGKKAFGTVQHLGTSPPRHLSLPTTTPNSTPSEIF